MRFIIFSSAGFLACVVFCGTVMSDDDPTRSIAGQIQGRWEIVSGVNQGRALLASEVRGTYVTVKDNQIVTFDSQENQKYKATFVVDDSLDPVQIKMTSVLKEVVSNNTNAADQAGLATVVNNESVAVGILRIDNPRKWTLCYAIPGFERPTRFESPSGSKVLLFTLEKQ